MKTILFCGALLAAVACRAQDLFPSNPVDLLAAQPGEPVVVASLRTIVVARSAVETGSLSPSTTGVQLLDLPELRESGLGAALEPFLGGPVSLGSLERMQNVVRIALQLAGRSVARVYIPPQDVTDGAVRVVVQLATLDHPVQVAGHRWFARENYLDALSLRPGEVFDARVVTTDVAWLNRNPFRRVAPQLEAGASAGTTRMTLRAEERFPLSLLTSFDNTGTRLTGEQRASAGFTWGNALGRGDLLNYRFSGDPSLDHVRSHSAGYTAFLPWRHVLTLQAAHSRLDSAMPQPFTQGGTSWQAGARYELPLRAPRAGWSQNLSFSADFKYSDNTLEFATIPITDNVTHVAQVGASYGLSFRALGGQNSVSLSGYASPGGLTRYNKTRAFDGSRAGARADYVYGQLNLSHQRLLWYGFSGQTRIDAQVASGALLGSEQLNGGGTYAVRGYRDSSAYGDWGVVVTNELHAPGFSLLKGQDQLDLFAFIDAASLNLNIDHESTDLRSVGFGLTYQWRRYLSVRASYGWQLKYLDGATDKARAHFGASLNW